MSDERRLYAPVISPVRATALIAANIIEARGLCQNAGETPDGAVCPARALELAGDACAHAYNHFSGYLRARFGVGDIERWSDTRGRTEAGRLRSYRSAMGMRPGDKDLEREQRAAARTHDAAQRALCVEAITEWNRLMERRYKPRWSPMIGVAIAAEFFWLDVVCPGCRQVKQVDLLMLDRHPQTTLYALIPKLSCRSCQPSPPFAQLLRLSRQQWVSDNKPAYVPRRGL